MPSSAVPPRPAWMTAILVFCLATLLFCIPRDLFVPGPRDVEVWFGFELHGRWAALTAPLHWAIFATGAWGAWRQRVWVRTWAVGYGFYVAASHLVWNLVSPHGDGWGAGMAEALAMAACAAVLFARSRQGA